MDREYRYRLAESMIQKAKYLLGQDGDWENYADIEISVSNLERCRSEVEQIIRKCVSNSLK